MDYQYLTAEAETNVTFRSKAIVMSQGGLQQSHPRLYDWFPALKREKVLLSDYFLKTEGFLATMKRIKEHKIKKIVILGGSHSGFSAAWMLINGPADLWHNTHIKTTQ